MVPILRGCGFDHASGMLGEARRWWVPSPAISKFAFVLGGGKSGASCKRRGWLYPYRIKVRGTMRNLNQLPIALLHYAMRSSGARTRASSVVSSRQCFSGQKQHGGTHTTTLQITVTQCDRFAAQILVFARLRSTASRTASKVSRILVRQAITQVRGTSFERRPSDNRTRQPAPPVINTDRCGALTPLFWPVHMKGGQALSTREGERRLCQEQKKSNMASKLAMQPDKDLVLRL